MAGTENQEKGSGGPFNMIKNMVFQWPLSVKIGVGVAIVAVIIVAMLVNSHNAQFKMVPIYAKDVSTDDVEEIKLQLIKMGYNEGVEFDIVKGEKTSYLVAQTILRNKMVSQLADMGLPRSVRTTSDNTESGGFTQTEDERATANLRGLEGDMEMSIMMMEGIIDANVKIVPRKESLFQEQEEPGKSTVMIKTRDNYSISKAQIQGIINLVVGSVEGLTPENISVVDTRGITLSDLVAPEVDEFGVPTSSAQQDRQKDFEKSLTNSAQELLDKTLGDGNAFVEVRANLNFDQKEQQMEVLGSPTGGGTSAPVSLSTDSEAYSSGGENQGYITIGGRTVGVNQAAGFEPVSTGSGDQMVPPGNGGHVISYQVDAEKYDNAAGGDDGVTPAGGGADGKASNYDHTVTQVNVEYDKYQTHIITAPGGVDRLSVALMLNSIPEGRVEEIKNAVAACVGIDPSRGDVVSVSNFPFNRSEYEEMREEMLSAPVVPADNASGTSLQIPAVNKAVIGWAGAAIVLLLLIVFALFLAKQKKSDKEKMQLNLTAGSGSSINPIADLLSDKSGRTVAPSSNNGTSVDELTRLAKEKPTQIAELLKTSWMADR